MDERPALLMHGLTDTGRVRALNEDAIRWDAGAGWAILADGMGGHLAGEVASAMAVETIAGFLEDFPLEAGAAEETLRAAVATANQAIHAKAQSDPQCRNMGTTVVVALVHDGMLSCAHVGDSRLYRHNAAGLALLSHDHSLVQELVDEGMLSAEDAADSVHKNVITRALGLREEVEADVLEVPTAAGDLFLLCSDGLSDKLSEAELETLLRGDDLEGMAVALVACANGHGGEDNISVLLIRIG